MKKLLYIFLLLMLVFPSKSFSYGYILEPNTSYNLSIDVETSTTQDDEGNDVEQQGISGNIDGQTYSQMCGNIIEDNNLKKRVFTTVMMCVERIISRGTDKLFFNYISNLALIVFYIIMLAIIFHGIRMMMGAVTDHGMTIMLVVKIMVILFFCSPQGSLYAYKIKNALISFPKTISYSVLQAVGDPGVGAQILQAINPLDDINQMTSNTAAPGQGSGVSTLTNIFTLNIQTTDGDDGYAVYEQLDILILKLFGLSQDEAEDPNLNDTTYIGIAAFLVSYLFSGSMGTAIGMIVFIYMTAILFAVAELIFFYVIIFVAINFLAALTPLALTCMLFNSTKRITQIWLNYLIAYSIQPIIAAFFLMFMLITLQDVGTNFSEFSQRIKTQWQDTDNKQKISLVDCIGGDSFDTKKSKLGNTKSLGEIFQNANMAKSFSDRNSFGNLNPEDYSTISADNNCGLSFTGLKVGNGLGLETGPTTNEIRGILGGMIATVLLLVLMISFLRYFPQMINQIVGNTVSTAGVGGNATQFATKTAGLAGRAIGGIKNF